MPVLGITGGIATGKSTFARRVCGLLSARLFDADQEARRLTREDAGVQRRIAEAFGPGVLGPDGKLDRAVLRERAFASPADRRKLEAILHPAIRSAWVTLAEGLRRERNWLIVDIPLLYETGAESECDAVAVVACQAATQRARIVSERGLDAAMAERIIAAQESLASKITKADHVVWSEAPLAALDSQAALLAAYLQERYG